MVSAAARVGAPAGAICALITDRWGKTQNYDSTSSRVGIRMGTSVKKKYGDGRNRTPVASH
jgi:hypothetical protein